MKTAFVFLAEGFEDVEALATVDVLRRGGVRTVMVSISGEPYVTSSHNTTVWADVTLEDGIDIEESDAMIFPGGMPGSKNLAACEPLMDFMKEHYSDGGLVAAICAAPGLVVGQIPSLQGMDFTCFDGFEDALIAKGAIYHAAPAITCGNLITGRSAGYAPDFALQILKYLKGEEVEAKVRHALYLD